MMKKRTGKGIFRRVLALLTMVLLLASPAVLAQTRRMLGGSRDDNFHFLYVGGGAGYNTLFVSNGNTTSTGHTGGHVSVGYEFRLNGFWASVGPQLSFSNTTIALDPVIWKPKEDRRYAQYTFYDDQDKVISPRYDIEQEDVIRWTFLDIPVMVGYYTHGFYVGAGGKFSYAISSDVVSTGNYTFSGTYDLYGNNSPGPEVGHGYIIAHPYESKGEAIRTLPSFSLVGEVGYDVLSSTRQRGSICHILKIGFYFEYGLTNMVQHPEQESRYEFKTLDNRGNYDLRYPTIHPYFRGSADQARVIPLYTGLKLTYLIGGSKTAKSGYHRGCQCYN